MTLRHLAWAAALLAAAPAFAQTYSSPVRNVENPDRSAFMFGGSTTIALNRANAFINLATPPGFRYFVDYVSVTCTTPNAADVITEAYATVIRSLGAGSFGGYGVPAIAMTRRGASSGGGYLWSGAAEVKGLFADPDGSASGGANLYFNIFHTDGTAVVNCNGMMAGHTLVP